MDERDPSKAYSPIIRRFSPKSLDLTGTASYVEERWVGICMFEIWKQLMGPRWSASKHSAMIMDSSN
jgi:hypothetical protein